MVAQTPTTRRDGDKTTQANSLTLSVRDEAPIDQDEISLDLPWESTRAHIRETIEAVDGLGNETIDAAIDIYSGDEGWGFGQWATARENELIRGTNAPHDGLPGVGKARAERLVEERDDRLPTHPVVDWLREHPDVALIHAKPEDGSDPAHLTIGSSAYGYRYEGEEEDAPYRGLFLLPLIRKTTNTNPERTVSRWAYRYLHHNDLIAVVTPTDTLWFDEDE